MALNVNNTALYKAQGIDTNSVNAITAQILKTPKVQNIDFSKFNRSTHGIDLYSSRTDIDLQRQIALTQAGLYVNAINVAPLNSNAAANLYANNKVSLVQNSEDKNSNSSNSFNPFGKQEDEETEK